MPPFNTQQEMLEAMKTAEKRDRLSFFFSYPTGAEFDIFGLGLHYHSPLDEEPCSIRSTVFITIANLQIHLGIIRDYVKRMN